MVTWSSIEGQNFKKLVDKAFTVWHIKKFGVSDKVRGQRKGISFGRLVEKSTKKP
jgi:hypothetical protein